MTSSADCRPKIVIAFVAVLSLGAEPATLNTDTLLGRWQVLEALWAGRRSVPLDAAPLTSDHRASLEAILPRYAEFTPWATSSDPKLRRLAATAFRRRAAIQHLLGKVKEAQTEYRRAAEILGALADQDPTSPRARLELAAAFLPLADLLASADRPNEAAEVQRKGAAALQEAARLPGVTAADCDALTSFVLRGGTSPAEVYSGKALNHLLAELRRIARDGVFPDLPLAEAVLARVNLGTKPGGIRVLRDGRLLWPAALAEERFARERRRLDLLLPSAVRLARSWGRLDPDVYEPLGPALKQLDKRLMEEVADMTPSEYIESKRYLNALEAGIQSLRRPDAGSPFSLESSARGRSVAELLNYLAGRSLHVAPALEGDEAAYLATWQALVACREAGRKPRD
jgi:hypothetical protein